MILDGTIAASVAYGIELLGKVNWAHVSESLSDSPSQVALPTAACLPCSNTVVSSKIVNKE